MRSLLPLLFAVAAHASELQSFASLTAGRTDLHATDEHVWCYMLDSSHADVASRYGDWCARRHPNHEPRVAPKANSLTHAQPSVRAVDCVAPAMTHA